MTAKPPEQIYLQCYEDDGSLFDFVRDDVTWCVDQINDSDAVYILVTPELAALLERLAKYADIWGDWDTCNDDTDAAHALTARIREVLDDSQA